MQIDEATALSVDVATCLPCRWEVEPYRLWSLLDMLRLDAGAFMKATGLLPQLSMLIDTGRGFGNQGMAGFGQSLGDLERECGRLGLNVSLSQINLIKGRLSGPGFTWEECSRLLKELYGRIIHELDARSFLMITPEKVRLYEMPLDGWESVGSRFKCSFDIEEARKCLALDRSTAAVFHLMRVVESAVLELQMFLREPDVKAHFGSVLNKLEQLTQKQKYHDVKDELKPYLGFLRDVLAQLHAVKDSWRDKVTHVDIRIVPIETFTPELASGVHDATLLLMKKLANGLPPQATT